jgi:adenine phosphoribosyltransferase
MTKFLQITQAVREAETQPISLASPSGGTYQFFPYAFGERGTNLSYELSQEIIDGLCSNIQRYSSQFDYIIAPEPGGHIWGLPVALQLQRPLNVLRLQRPDSGGLMVSRSAGYREDVFHLRNINKGDRIILIDDIISTGGTLDALLGVFNKFKISTTGVHVIYAKSDDYKKISEKHETPIHPLVLHSDVR